MRSRYAAFARGDTGYLVKSQAKSQTGDASSYRTERTVRFLDLAILHTSVDGDRGEVLFYARLYERGVDRSFVELSDFVREAGEWRYASGVTVATTALPADPRTLTRDDVLRMNAAG
jgi:SEC-C motif-containing protein